MSEEHTVIAGAAEEDARRPDGVLMPGDMLNGIYRVERFIARGGMGEVFEGTNIEAEERVAIKAIRAHLASDPKVVALFRKEARILTHIAHPAIVQYRVFARDPVLNLHYIVTDFIDGEPITVGLDGKRPDARAVVTLARRLAAGLEAAHDHGAIHRDMSPDNVLLPAGRIDRAKIIDFGIAKRADLVGETLVGDGFAGKLGYVAPEQFGDFGRQIGPWTDIYSTALTLLAFARGAPPPMGATLSEAVERRRTRPDIADLPMPLIPLIERMLTPDPMARIRSMREVLMALDDIRLSDDRPVTVPPTTSPVLSVEAKAGPAAPHAAPTMFAPASDPPATPAIVPAKQGGIARQRRFLMVGLPLGLIVAGVGAAALMRGDPPPAAPAPQPPTIPVARGPSAMPQAGPTPAETSVQTPPFADVRCAWVDPRPGKGGGAATFMGAAADPGALSGNNGASAADFAGVRQATIEQCPVIEALRPFKAAGGRAPFPASVVSKRMADCAGGFGGRIAIRTAGRDRTRALTALFLHPDGRVTSVVRGADALKRGTRGGVFRESVCYESGGPAALFVIDSAKPLPLDLDAGRPVAVGPGFARGLAAAKDADVHVVGRWMSGRYDPLHSQAMTAASRPGRAGTEGTAPAPMATGMASGEQTAEPKAAVPAGGAAASRGGKGDAATAHCQKYDGGWSGVGFVTRDACITQFRRCSVVFVSHDGDLIRRRGRQIELQKTGGSWVAIARARRC